MIKYEVRAMKKTYHVRLHDAYNIKAIELCSNHWRIIITESHPRLGKAVLVRDYIVEGILPSLFRRALAQVNSDRARLSRRHTSDQLLAS